MKSYFGGESTRLTGLGGKIKRRLRSWTQLNLGQVYFQLDGMNNLLPLRNISPLYIVEMQPNQPSHVESWLNIVNQAFSREWIQKQFDEAILNHPYYDVTHTYLLMDEQKCIGVVSEAVFAQNKQIGVTHYLGLDQKYLGKGLGKYLILYTLHQMHRHGLSRCEGESTLRHSESLLIHFSLGFSPKPKPDYWNTPNRVSPLTKLVTNAKYQQFYDQWVNRKKANERKVAK